MPLPNPDEGLILVVDDSEDDALLLKRAFQRAGIRNPLHIVHSGEDAVSYLSGSGTYADRAQYPLPELLLLDLKMPGIGGLEVLRWIRQQQPLKTLTVLLLSSSHLMSDMKEACRLGANSFLVKPTEFEGLVELAKALYHYWLVERRPIHSQTTSTSPEPAHA